jgi:hypothetical protein
MERPEELTKSWLRLCADPRTASELLDNATYWESINTPKEYQIRLAVAKHRSASAETLAKLSMVKNLKVQIAVAAHSNLSESTAAEMLKTQVRELRRSLAGNPSIPIFVMQRLSRDFEDVRLRLAKNTALPLQIQQRLMNEVSKSIRIALCQNRRLHPSVMERLSHDTDEDVRLELVEHPDMPRGGLKQMAEDTSARVRAAVLARARVDFADDVGIFKALMRHRDPTSDGAKLHLEGLEQNQTDTRLWDETTGEA